MPSASHRQLITFMSSGGAGGPEVVTGYGPPLAISPSYTVMSTGGGRHRQLPLIAGPGDALVAARLPSVGGRELTVDGLPFFLV